METYICAAPACQYMMLYDRMLRITVSVLHGNIASRLLLKYKPVYVHVLRLRVSKEICSVASDYEETSSILTELAENASLQQLNNSVVFVCSFTYGSIECAVARLKVSHVISSIFPIKYCEK